MKIAVMKERRQHERRVAASPETVKKLSGLGAKIVVESGAGAASHIADETFADAGAEIANDASAALSGADVIFTVQGLDGDELAAAPADAILLGVLNPFLEKERLDAIANQKLTAFAMEFMPRITRAQSMDVLSSQSNLSGYKAVLEACSHYDRSMPMMMTAAGTVAPARVLVMGAGVAGLQAIATAKRLGAIVSATDVRLAAKEQVESLGGKFVMVDDDEAKEAETSGGYAKEMSDAYKEKQAALIAETIKKQDIVITTALIPGREAPQLVSEEMLKSMKPGSVIVDLAAEQGGNCALAKPGEVVEAHGVKIVGAMNMPSRLAADASSLYAKNLFNFISPLIDKDSGALAIDWDDELIKGTLITKGGSIVHERLTS
ncbi:MAG: Re/Si-specific NAD(P)(+) transhydrogenase subunit alpha [Pseudomonadota bacterium]